MADFAGLLGQETYSKKDPRSLSQVLEDAIRRHHETIDTEQAGYNLGQQKQLSDLVNPIRDSALRSVQPGSDNVPPWMGGQAAQVPPQMQVAQASQNLPPSLQAGETAIRTPPPQFGVQQDNSEPYEAALSEAAKIREERAQFEAERTSTQAAVAVQSSPVIKAMMEAKDANLTAREGQAGQKAQLAIVGKVNDLIPKLNSIMTPSNPAKGWNPMTGEKGTALAKASSLIPAYLLDNPKVKDWLAFQRAEQQQTVFNPAGAGGVQMRDLNSLRSQSIGDSKTYQVARDALNAAEAEYTNYLKDPNSKTNRVDQQGIIDKYTMISLGKSPTEAQIELAQQFPGIQNWLDLTSGRLKTGQIIPKEATDEMMRNMRGTVINYGNTLKQKNERQVEEAELGGIDPRRVITVPNQAITQDSTRFDNANRSNSQTKIKVIANKSEYDALPSGATYIGPSGHKAKKP